MTTNVSVDYDALVRDDRVHSRVYTDSQIFADEMERIFHRGWVFVGHASEIPEPGDYRLAWVGRYPIIMVRGADGEVRLLSNRCRHRANTVCQLERGNTRFFRCDYHGWMYRNDGSLASVSYPEGYDRSFDKADFGLIPLPRMATYRGFVFGSIAPDGMTLADYLGPASDQIDLFCDLSPLGEIDARGGVPQVQLSRQLEAPDRKFDGRLSSEFRPQVVLRDARPQRSQNSDPPLRWFFDRRYPRFRPRPRDA